MNRFLCVSATFAIGLCGLSVSECVFAAEPALSAASPTEANKASVRRLFKAFNEGDLATLNEISDRHRVIHTATGSTARNGEPRKTLAEACPMCAALNPRNISIDFIMAEGDLVTVRSTWRGKYHGVMRDIPISGKDVTVYYTNTYRLKDGRIVENWAAYDRWHLLEQLGFGISPPTEKPAK